MMIRACSYFFLKSLDSDLAFYCQVKSLLAVTVAVFFICSKRLLVSSNKYLLCLFLYFFLLFFTFFSFQFFITSENCTCLLM